MCVFPYSLLRLLVKTTCLRLEAEKCFFAHEVAPPLWMWFVCRLKTFIPIKGTLAPGCVKIRHIFSAAGEPNTFVPLRSSATGQRHNSKQEKTLRATFFLCVFFCFSRPGEDVSHGAQGPDAPEADQRSGASPDPPGDPQRWRCRAGRAQPTGTGATASQKSE